MLGVTFGWGAPMGYAAAAGRIDGTAGVALRRRDPLDLGYDTIYAHQDREDDALIGVRSTARLFGRHSRAFLAACYGGTVMLLALAGYRAGLSLWFYAGLAAAGGDAGAPGGPARHRRPGALPAPVPVQPRGRVGGRGGALARLAVTDPAAFLRANTVIGRPALVPEIALHLASEITPIWQATEAWLAETGIEPPFWAFAWPGGQALARHILDHPESVAGRRVLDFAAGGGIAAIAAARAGAAVVEAVEIDPLAVAAIRANAALNGTAVTAVLGDIG